MHKPIKGPFLTIRAKSLNNSFGIVRKDKKGNPQGHQGWDIAAFVGTPVFAVADGEVSYILRERKIKDKDGILKDAPYGNEVCLGFRFNGKDLFAQYAHLKSFNVSAGQRVKEGDLIGYVGQTGNARLQHHSDAHLHFELRTVGTPLGKGLGGRLDPSIILGCQPLLDIIFDESLMEVLNNLAKI